MKKARKTIVREFPPIGTNLFAKFKGVSYNARIVSDKTMPTGKAVEYSDSKYRSMTAATQAVTKQPVMAGDFGK